MQKPPTKVRECSTCTACCTGLNIESKPGYSTTFDTGEDIAKPAGVQCRFWTNTGCGNYANRPLVCRQFRCDWLVGRVGYGPHDNPNSVGHIGIRGNQVPYKRLSNSA